MAQEQKEVKQILFTDRLNSAALRLLYGAGMVFLIFVVIISIKACSNSLSDDKTITLKVTEFKINKNDSTLHQLDKGLIDSLNEFNQNLDFKIRDIQSIDKDLKEIDEKNTDLFKLFLAIIGSIFAIVGFFGFKSIYETRENAVKAAVANADKEAQRVAAQVAKEEVANISIPARNDIATLKEEIRAILIRIDDLENTKSNIQSEGEPDTPTTLE